jgi:hypothetical protein
VRGSRRRQLHRQDWRGLPDGAFVELDGAPQLVLGKELVEWTREGYGARRRRPARGATVAITPPSTLAALRAGYPVQIDQAAR